MRCACRFVPTGGALPAPSAVMLRDAPQCAADAVDGSNYCAFHDPANWMPERRQPRRWTLAALVGWFLAVVTLALLYGCAPAPKVESGEPCFIWVVQPDGSRTCLETRP